MATNISATERRENFIVDIFVYFEREIASKLDRSQRPLRSYVCCACEWHSWAEKMYTIRWNLAKQFAFADVFMIAWVLIASLMGVASISEITLLAFKTAESPESFDSVDSTKNIVVHKNLNDFNILKTLLALDSRLIIYWNAFSASFKLKFPLREKFSQRST